MKGLEPMPMPEHPNWVMFQLKRNDENRDAWSVLFGPKSFFFGTRQNDEIALTIGLQDGSWGAKNPQILYLEYLPDWRSWLVLPHFVSSRGCNDCSRGEGFDASRFRRSPNRRQEWDL